MNASKPRGFELPSFGSLFTLPVPFSPLFFGGSNMSSCSGMQNQGQCENFSSCSPSTNEDTCQNMALCDDTINENDCGNLMYCEFSSNLDGCTNNTCFGSQNNGDGDWILCEGCTNHADCNDSTGGPYPVTMPNGKHLFA